MPNRVKFLKPKSKLDVKSKHNRLLAYRFFETLSHLWALWPLRESSWDFIRLSYEVFSQFVFINLFVAATSSAVSIFSYYKNPVVFAKNVSLFMILIDSFSHCLFYNLQRKHYRVSRTK